MDGSVSAGQGIRIILADGSRVVARLSGTGTEGATLRVYLECYRKDAVDEPIERVLSPLVKAANELLRVQQHCGVSEPTVIT